MEAIIAELVGLVSTQGLGLVIGVLFIVGLWKGVPSFFKWTASQWEDLKGVFKNYMGEQVSAMKEVTNTNAELVKMVGSVSTKVESIEERVESIDGKVDQLLLGGK